MTISEWLITSTQKLIKNNISTARLDAEVLLSNVLGKDRSWIVAHDSDNIKESLRGIGSKNSEEVSVKLLDEMIERRSQHEPIAYILGFKEFYGRDFIVTKDTLQPRPETENMIDILKELKPKTIIDVGAGSGCIAISAKLEVPESLVIATDISQDCIDIAQRNAEKLNADINFMISDLIQDIDVRKIAGSTLCCNLPYVPDDFEINNSAKFEPELALFGGEDGLEYYRQLIEQTISIPENLRPSYLITEALLSQHQAVIGIVEIAGFELTDTRDLIQMFIRIE